MINITRTDSDNKDFRQLIQQLDAYLAESDGQEKHAFYKQYNKVDNIRNVIVAYADDIPVGCGAIKEFDAATVEVKRMFVLPEHRGQGIAGQVLRALETWAKELGYTQSVLETGKKMEDAIQLYRSKGYWATENYGQYAGVETSVCMKKQL